jgi:hypothetical protein
MPRPARTTPKSAQSFFPNGTPKNYEAVVLYRERIEENIYWVVQVLSPGNRRGIRAYVDHQDAWSLDLYRGLQLLITFRGARIPDGCRVQRRVTNNKNFVKV